MDHQKDHPSVKLHHAPGKPTHPTLTLNHLHCVPLANTHYWNVLKNACISLLKNLNILSNFIWIGGNSNFSLGWGDDTQD